MFCLAYVKHSQNYKIICHYLRLWKRTVFRVTSYRNMLIGMESVQGDICYLQNLKHFSIFKQGKGCGKLYWMMWARRICQGTSFLGSPSFLCILLADTLMAFVLVYLFKAGCSAYIRSKHKVSLKSRKIKTFQTKPREMPHIGPCNLRSRNKHKHGICAMSNNVLFLWSRNSVSAISIHKL